MMAFFRRVLAFFIKEIHDVRRQPRLMLSLVGGPLLVLAVFGATFRSSIPRVSVVLVWPQEGLEGVDLARLEKLINLNFRLYGIVNDLDEAMLLLERGQVDVVQVLPDAAQIGGDSDLRPQLQVFSRTVDPVTESWIRSISTRQRSFLNQLLLVQQVVQAQGRADELRNYLSSAQGDLSALAQLYTLENKDNALLAISRTRLLLYGLLAVAPQVNENNAQLTPEVTQVVTEVKQLLEDLNALQQVIVSDQLQANIERLDQSLNHMTSLDEAIVQFKALPPEDVAAPIGESYTNLSGETYSLVVFFAPAVLALLVQHLSITLAALAFVRERQMGAFEMFRVAPLSMFEVMLGKTLAYTVYVSLAGGALAGLLVLLDVPAPEQPLRFAALLVLVALASIGIGFVISSVATSDSQAIQLTMLSLLLSIFFSGFFLPIDGFLEPAKIVTYSLPMTYAITGFQSLLLSARDPGREVWLGLTAITLLSFALTVVLMRHASRGVHRD